MLSTKCMHRKQQLLTKNPEDFQEIQDFINKLQHSYFSHIFEFI